MAIFKIEGPVVVIFLIWYRNVTLEEMRFWFKTRYDFDTNPTDSNVVITISLSTFFSRITIGFLVNDVVIVWS